MPPMLEMIAVALGLANIVLLIRRSIWNYPFGLVMVALYFLIFRDARLYSDMLLQVFFFAVQGWGWRAWARAGGLDGPVAVARLSNDQRWYWSGGVILATALWGWGMHYFTDATAPWWDAAVAMGSVAAQILLVQRRIENWVGWIIVDVLAIGLFASRGLNLTAGLYGVFLLLSIWGLIEWRRAARVAAMPAA